MEPKEKAKEIYTRFDSLFPHPFKVHNKLKQCALVAVDELFLATDDFDLDTKEYWQEVKQEIENL